MISKVEKRVLAVLRVLFVLFVFCLFLFLSEYTVNIIRYERNEQLREKVSRRSSAVQAALTNEINITANLALGLIGPVIINQELTVEDFNRLAKMLYEKSDIITRISIAPDNVVSYVYPYEGNKDLIGLDYMESPRTRQAIDNAVRFPNGLLTGPVEENGKEVFISRIPIYTGSTGYNYWGLAGIAIDKEKLFRKVNISASDYWLKISIKGKDGLGLQGGMITGDAEIFKLNPVLTTINLPEGLWIMAAVPASGWEAEPTHWDYIIWTIGIILDLIICSMLIYFFAAHKKNEGTCAEGSADGTCEPQTL